MATLKAFKIKLGTLKRTHKELMMYEKEVKAEQEKLERLQAAGADSHDIKQQEGVLAESNMMVPDTRRRLEVALGAMKAALVEVEKDETVTGTEDYTVAQELVKEVDLIFQ
eukprot:jgi/Mesvir1/7492/Mv19252-RA.1